MNNFKIKDQMMTLCNDELDAYRVLNGFVSDNYDKLQVVIRLWNKTDEITKLDRANKTVTAAAVIWAEMEI